MKIVVSCGSTMKTAEILDETIEKPIMTLGDLRDFIATEYDVDRTNLMPLHKGKCLKGDDDFALNQLDIRENDKIIIMGAKKAATMASDPGFAALIDYEKKNLNNLQKDYEEIGNDLTELEKNFLDESKQRELARKLDKRLKWFNEISERHLTSLDGLQIKSDKTSDSQMQRNREKRKSLISGIQTLLNGNDVYVRRLEEYLKKLDGEIIE